MISSKQNNHNITVSVLNPRGVWWCLPRDHTVLTERFLLISSWANSLEDPMHHIVQNIVYYNYMKTICKMWQASRFTLTLDLKFHVYTIHRGCIHFSERETLEPSHCVNVASQQCRDPQDQCSRRQLPWPWMFWGNVVILLMEEIQHQLKGSLSDYFQFFFHLRRCRILPSTVCHCMSLW